MAERFFRMSRGSLVRLSKIRVGIMDFADRAAAAGVPAGDLVSLALELDSREQRSGGTASLARPAYDLTTRYAQTDSVSRSRVRSRVKISGREKRAAP